MTIIKGKTTWVDVFKPNQDDISKIQRLGKFHKLVLGELLSRSARSRAEEHEGYIFITYHVPVYDSENKKSRHAEINLIITKNTIITARYEPLDQVDIFLQELLRNKALQEEILSQPSYVLLQQIMKHIMGFSIRQLRYVEERLGYIGNEIFLQKGTLLETIFYTKRDILDYLLIVRPHEEIFNSLLEAGPRLWGKQSFAYLSNISEENLRVFRRLENYFQAIESFEKSNAQIISAETNNTIKRFFIPAFLFFVPLLFILAMGVPYVNAIVNTPEKFWVIFLIIITAVSWSAYIIKKKKLL